MARSTPYFKTSSDATTIPPGSIIVRWTDGSQYTAKTWKELVEAVVCDHPLYRTTEALYGAMSLRASLYSEVPVRDPRQDPEGFLTDLDRAGLIQCWKGGT